MQVNRVTGSRNVHSVRDMVEGFRPDDIRAIVRAEIHRAMAGAAVDKIPASFDVSAEELPKASSRKVKRFLFSEARA